MGNRLNYYYYYCAGPSSNGPVTATICLLCHFLFFFFFFFFFSVTLPSARERAPDEPKGHDLVFDDPLRGGAVLFLSSIFTIFRTSPFLSLLLLLAVACSFGSSALHSFPGLACLFSFTLPFSCLSWPRCDDLFDLQGFLFSLSSFLPSFSSSWRPCFSRAPFFALSRCLTLGALSVLTIAVGGVVPLPQPLP